MTDLTNVGRSAGKEYATSKKTTPSTSSSGVGGGTDRPAGWVPDEEIQALSTPSTPEEIIGAATGQRPVVVPTAVTTPEPSAPVSPVVIFEEPSGLEAPSTPEEIIGAATGQRPILVPSEVTPAEVKPYDYETMGIGSVVETGEPIYEPVHEYSQPALEEKLQPTSISERPSSQYQVVEAATGVRPVYVPPGAETALAQRTREQIYSYPPGTTFIETPQGYIPSFERVSDENKIAYVESHGRFGPEGKTWADVKRENPAAYLVVQNGEVTTVIDTERWRREKYQRSEEQFGPVPGAVSRFASGVPMAFDVGFWNAVVNDRVGEYMGDWEYRMQQQYGIGTDSPDLLGFYAGEGLLLSPAYVNVVYPFAAGAGFAAGFGAIGAAGAKAAGTTAGRVLTGFAEYVPKATAVGLSGLVGADIGLTAAREQKGTIPSGSTIVKIGTLGMQFASAGAGAKLVSGWKPTVGIAQDKYGNIVLRKHLTTLRGEPWLAYGEPLAMGKTPEGAALVASPVKTKGLKFSTLENYTLKNIETLKSLIPYESPVGRPGVKIKQRQLLSVKAGGRSIVEPYSLKTGAIQVTPRYKTITKPVMPIEKEVTNIVNRIAPRGGDSEKIRVFKRSITKEEYPFERFQKSSDVKKIEIKTGRTNELDKIRIKTTGRLEGLDKTSDVSKYKYKKPALAKEGEIPVLGRTVDFIAPESIVSSMQIRGKTSPFDVKKSIVSDISAGEKPIKTSMENIGQRTQQVLVQKPVVEPKINYKLKKIASDTSQRMATSEYPSELSKPAFKRFGMKKSGYAGRYGYSLEEVLALEEGITGDISGFWAGVAPSAALSSRLEGRSNIIDRSMALNMASIQNQQQKNLMRQQQTQVNQQKNIQDTITITRPVSIQDVKTELLSQQITETMPKIKTFSTVLTKTIPNSIERIIQKPDIKIKEQPLGGAGGMGLLPSGFFDEPTGYGISSSPFDVYVLRTQYRDGKRIRGREWVKANKKPLSETDASRLGSHIVDNNAKRSFKIVKTTGRKHKLKSNIKGWLGQMDEYNYKGNGLYVEKNEFAIDSPGELKEITLKGIRSHSKKRGGFNFGSRGLESKINNMMRRRVR